MDSEAREQSVTPQPPTSPLPGATAKHAPLMAIRLLASLRSARHTSACTRPPQQTVCDARRAARAGLGTAAAGALVLAKSASGACRRSLLAVRATQKSSLGELARAPVFTKIRQPRATAPRRLTLPLRNAGRSTRRARLPLWPWRSGSAGRGALGARLGRRPTSVSRRPGLGYLSVGATFLNGNPNSFVSALAAGRDTPALRRSAGDPVRSLSRASRADAFSKATASFLR